MDWTTPAPREAIVVEPVTFNVPVMEEVAKLDCPVTNSVPLVKTVVEALLTVKRLEALVYVKVEEVAKVLLP